MRILRTPLVGLLVLAGLLALPQLAAAAQPAGTIDLTSVRAEGPVRDAILPQGARIAAGPQAVASADFLDSAGRRFTLDTTVLGFDLNPAAAVLNSIRHGKEISKLTAHAVPMASIVSICGNADAIACYRPMSGGYGELWFATDDSDWLHSLVHEYGHHLDNQYANVSQLRSYGYGNGCAISNDGTRDWYFARITASNTTDRNRFYCAGADWEHLIPELFAEDYVVLNGITGWQLSSAQPPNQYQLTALQYDLEHKLLRLTRGYKKRIRRGKQHKQRFSTPFYSLTDVTVKTAKGGDFDIKLYSIKPRKLWRTAKKRGRNERLTVFVAPGNWEIVVKSKRRRTGTAKIQIKLR